MQRQLARRGTAARGEHAFEPHEWAKNAQQIAAYYTSCNRFDWAEHCLRAAGAVLAAERKRTAGAPRAAESDTAKTRTYFGGKQQWKTVDVDEVNAAAAAPAAAAPAAAAPAAAAPAAAPAATSSSLSDSDKEEAARLDLSWEQQLVTMPSALHEDAVPSARLVPPGAQAAPTDPRAPLHHLGRLPRALAARLRPS